MSRDLIASLEKNSSRHLVNYDGPNNPKWQRPDLFTGVGVLYSPLLAGGGGSVCTGSLIGAKILLTAAHCVNQGSAYGDTFFYLQNPGGGYDKHTIKQSHMVKYSSYNPANPLRAEGDIAIMEMVTTPDTSRERYEIYTGNAFQTEVTHVGFGRNGNGDYGTWDGVGIDFNQRWGKNTYDVDVNWAFGGGDNPFCDVGVGLKEDGSLGDTGFIAGGDSGGPGFINGQIAGVHSWGGTFGCRSADSPDITCSQLDDPRYIADQLLPPSQRRYTLNNSSYGDVASDVRAAHYSTFINYHKQYGAIPEPSMIGLFCMALVGFGLYRRRRT